MIDFYSYEQVKLKDVAEFERAKAGHVYPRGSSTIQISATKGQIGYLQEPGQVPTKDVVIIPQAGIDPEYFNFVMYKNVDGFMNKYATGINIQEKEIGNFPIELHNYETQKAVAKFVRFVDESVAIEENELMMYENLKSKLLNEMMI